MRPLAILVLALAFPAAADPLGAPVIVLPEDWVAASEADDPIGPTRRWATQQTDLGAGAVLVPYGWTDALILAEPVGPLARWAHEQTLFGRLHVPGARHSAAPPAARPARGVTQ